MAAGLFGAIGYDMIRLVERLPDVNPDPLDLPDAVMTRPSIVAIFDAIAQEIILVDPGAADAASGRSRPMPRRARRASPAITADLAKPLAAARADAGARAPDAARLAGQTARAMARSSSRPRRYIAAGDIFQVVPSHRFCAPVRPATRSRSTGRCGGPTPRPSCSI